MTASSGKKFPWKKGCFILLILIAATLAYDIQKHQSFTHSNVGQFMKKSGMLSHSEKAYSVSKEYAHKTLAFIEATSPEYYKAAIDICSPYVKLATDFYLVFSNLSIKAYNNAIAYANKNGPVVFETIEYYVPGMLDEIYFHGNHGLELVKNYSAIAAEQVVEHYKTATYWLGKNIFVGKLSPESLQNYASRAIDTTQTLASQTYDWVYEKVQTLSKVP